MTESYSGARGSSEVEVFDKVPYDRTFLSFATFLKYIDYKYEAISPDTLRDIGKLGELISTAKSKQVAAIPKSRTSSSTASSPQR